MRWCSAPVLAVRSEAEANVTILDSRCGAAKLPGSAVSGCRAALLRQRPQRAGDGVSGINRTDGCHGSAS